MVQASQRQACSGTAAGLPLAQSVPNQHLHTLADTLMPRKELHSVAMVTEMRPQLLLVQRPTPTQLLEQPNDCTLAVNTRRQCLSDTRFVRSSRLR